MLCEHRGGDRPHAAGNGGNVGRLWRNGLKIHVSTEFPIAANINANVHNNTVFRDEISGDHLSLARSRDEDLRIPAGCSKIRGPRVADGDCCILLEQQHRKGFADDHASADYRYALPLQVNAEVSQHFHDRLRRAGSKTTFISGEDFCHVDWAHTVDIFLEIDHAPDRVFIQLFWKRPEQQDTVDVRIAVDGRELLLKPV